jgi:hypothetical protein
MKNTQKQHEDQKKERFKDVEFDRNNLEKYIYHRTSKGSPFIRIKIGKLSTDFVGKYQTIEQLKEKAIEFLKSI